MLNFILVVFFCYGALSEDTMDIFHLPTNTIPLFYDLKFVNLLSDNFTYKGIAKINIQAQQTTSELTLNAVDLDIESIGIFDVELKRQIGVESYELVKRNEQLKVNLQEPWLISGRQYRVEIVYNSELRTDMTGLYKSSYRDEEYNKTRWLAVSHFEPTHARKAFPCYDEPIHKTPFHITIVRKDTQISRSNYPISKSWQSPTGNLRYDDYEVSEPLPTYSVAISVSEFVTKPSDKKRIQVYTHKEYINQTDYIQQRAGELLHSMELFTTVPYPVKKIDLLAVPDFPAEAFGNWGLNTYQEEYLLISENSTEKSKELANTIVQRELAHQWFGNIVTCAWWDYVWLHESFATFFQYFQVETIEPDWRMEDVFVIEQHQLALSYDQRSRRPMTANVKSPVEISNIFDEIINQKGASVLKMLKYIITDGLFRQSLILYLNTNKYKNAEPKDLWDSIDSVLFETDYKLKDDVQIRDVMRSWTENEGYPIVKVTFKNKGLYYLTQKRFLIENNATSNNSKWYIGLTYTSQDKSEFFNLKPTEWLKPDDEHDRTIQIDDEGWFIFNLQSTGFYRVNYDDENWSRLIQQLKSYPKEIHVLNRAQLIDDSFNLAKAGELPISTSFNLVSYLEKEDDFIPWYTAMNELTYTNNQMRRCNVTTPLLKNFTRNLAAKVYNRVYNLYEKANDRKHLTVTSYDAFSFWACKLEVQECEIKALEYFGKWRKEQNIPPDVKEAAFCTGIRQGNDTEWNKVFNLYQTTQSNSERQAALRALACSKHITILNSYLRLILEGNCPIRQTHFKLMFDSLASTPLGIEVMTTFLKNNLNECLNKTRNAHKTIESIISALVKNVATDSEIDELKLIRNQTSLPLGLQKTFDTLYKEVEINLDYYEKTHKSLQDWLTQPKTPETNSSSPNFFISIILLTFNLLFYVLYF